MFKMQTDFDHNFRKNIAADEKYILRKMGFKFRNSKFNISCIIVLDTFLSQNVNSLKLRGQWGLSETSKDSWNTFYASIS